MKYTREQIKDTVEGLGYKYFTGDNYDVNIIGIRNSDTNGKITNKFDDIITISFRDENGDWQYYEYECTTDPGDDWMENPWIADKGCAVLKPGQYRGSHKLRLHSGKYLALGQKKPVTVYRDDNKDDVYDTDEDTIKEGIYGINIHRSNPYDESYYVNKWSAGCQVFKKVKDFNMLMDICYKAKDQWGNSFTYTLIESKNIK